MVFFTLSNFYHNYTINDRFKEIVSIHPEYLKKPVIFSFATGNFPYAYWNGGYNNNKPCKGITYKDVLNINFNPSLCLRFNCSNIHLYKNDFDDTFMNMVLELNQTGSNAIEVSDYNLFGYLKTKYPNYKYVLSHSNNLLNKFNINKINELTQKKQFDLIILPEQYTNDISFLQSLNNKSNIELYIMPVCNLQCKNYEKCLKDSHLQQYAYTNFNCYKKCPNHIDFSKIMPLLTLDEIFDTYVPMGFTHFNINEVIDDDIDNYKNFLVNYFIKDEYKNIVLNYILRGNN